MAGFGNKSTSRLQKEQFKASSFFYGMDHHAEL